MVPGIKVTKSFFLFFFSGQPSHRRPALLVSRFSDIPQTEERFKECCYVVNTVDGNSEKWRYKLEPIFGAATNDLSDMYMHSQIDLTDRRGAPSKSTVEASTVNNILRSSFKKMTFYLKDKAILDMSNFGFAQYFVNRLGFDQKAVNTWMSTQG